MKIEEAIQWAERMEKVLLARKGGDDLQYAAALRALVDAAGRWRGIESAPKDGTSILGAQGSHNEPAVIRWISARDGDTERVKSQGGFWTDDREVNLWFAFPPTHWRPLPPAPEA